MSGDSFLTLLRTPVPLKLKAYRAADGSLRWQDGEGVGANGARCLLAANLFILASLSAMVDAAVRGRRVQASMQLSEDDVILRNSSYVTNLQTYTPEYSDIVDTVKLYRYHNRPIKANGGTVQLGIACSAGRQKCTPV